MATEHVEEQEKRTTFQPGDVFADYTLLCFCGKGAYGEVYFAEDISGKVVAIKITPIAEDDEIWRMELIGLRYYRQNVDDHASLVEIYHVGENGDYFYHTMEPADNLLHEGEGYIADTLAHRLERGGRLTPEKALQLTLSVLSAIQTLNAHHLVHRDIKPGNIIFVNGVAKLSDVGLITDYRGNTGRVGTVSYMPPEIANGKGKNNSGNDFYALGKVLYCALTGLQPDRYPEVPITVPMMAWKQLRGAVLRACADDPRERFYVAEDFKKALPLHIREARWYDQVFEWMRRQKQQHPVYWRLGKISAILWILGLGTLGVLHYLQLREIREQEQRRFDFIFSITDYIAGNRGNFERYAESSGTAAKLRRIMILSDYAVAARARSEWEACERFCELAEAQLQFWAEDEFRKLQEAFPVENVLVWGNLDELNSMLARYDRFRELPFLPFLRDNSRNLLFSTLRDMEQNIGKCWHGPIPGKDWCWKNNEEWQFCYIAPALEGAHIDQPYWIARNEVVQHAYSDCLAASGNRHNPASNRGGALPQENLCWNDWLELCYVLTIEAEQNNELPEGYLYRPPYAEEWLFAASGGWHNIGIGGRYLEHIAWSQLAWYGSNSRYRTHAVRKLHPNGIGLYDTLGNVEELVMRANADGALELYNYGGSFRDHEIMVESDQLQDEEGVASMWGGARLVLGKGDVNFFARNWYTGKARSWSDGELTWELMGGEGSSWDSESGEFWAYLLGARLGQVNESVREYWNRQRAYVAKYICMIGAEPSADQQQWQWADGSLALENAEWLLEEDKCPETARSLSVVFDHDFFRTLELEESAPLLLLEWNHDEWIQMLARQLSPDASWQRLGAMEKEAYPVDCFECGNHRYALIAAPGNWYALKRGAELLGGRLAVLDQPEMLAGVWEKIQQSATEYHSIALGGYHYYQGWRWLNESALTPRISDDAQNQSSWNRQFAALQANGEIGISGEFDSFLCEFPPYAAGGQGEVAELRK